LAGAWPGHHGGEVGTVLAEQVHQLGAWGVRVQVESGGQEVTGAVG
jgi:hypothetical protein